MPECHSTNAKAMELIRREAVNHGTLIHTDYQLTGKGQKGNVWVSEPETNLLFSLILKLEFLDVNKAYMLNIMTSLVVRDVVSRMLGNKLVEVKWPNDLYVEEKKIGGILVETLLRGKQVEYAVIGVGLNVNQQHFSLAKATSMYLQKGNSFDRSLVMDNLLKSMEHYFLMLRSLKFDFLLSRYHDCLMWRDELHSFQIVETGEVMDGVIIGINDGGKLIIEHSNMVKHYDIKQVSFLA